MIPSLFKKRPQPQIKPPLGRTLSLDDIDLVYIKNIHSRRESGVRINRGYYQRMRLYRFIDTIRLIALLKNSRRIKNVKPAKR